MLGSSTVKDSGVIRGFGCSFYRLGLFRDKRDSKGLSKVWLLAAYQGILGLFVFAGTKMLGKRAVKELIRLLRIFFR